jgi:membrane protease YdiL (CAAX protease family)
MAETSGLRALVRARPLLTFFILAYLLHWLAMAPLILAPGAVSGAAPDLLAMLGATTPTIAALLVQWLAEGNLRICKLGRPWSLVLLSAVLGILLVILVFAVGPALVLTGGAFGGLHWSAIAGASLLWWSNPLNLLGGPLNEEPGWRGFALPRLQTRFGPLLAALLLGLLWTGWHLPLLLVGGLGVPLWAFAIMLVCLTVLMTWMSNLSGGGILAPILMHAVFNSSTPMLRGLCQGLPTMGPGLMVFLVVAVALTIGVIVGTRGRLGLGRP